MPFRPDMYDAYFFGYRWAVDKLGAEIRRLDENWHSGEIVYLLNQELENADIVIGDTTGANPNVLYEIGFATALKKPIILTCQKDTELPFDIKGRNHIVYDNIVNLRAPLLEAVRAVLDKT